MLRDFKMISNNSGTHMNSNVESVGFQSQEYS